jgi:hypothetical protein
MIFQLNFIGMILIDYTLRQPSSGKKKEAEINLANLD